MGLFGDLFRARLNGDLGTYGEALTGISFEIVNLFGRKGKTLRNIYIPKDNGETTEIDVLFISSKGLFVIESKNYSGWIFGREQDRYWTQSLPRGEKNRFYNPIKQNQAHLKWLSLYLQKLGLLLPMCSIIVFSERCSLKSITVDSMNVAVIRRGELFETVKILWESMPDVLSDEQVLAIYDFLSVLANADESVKLMHAMRIQSKYGMKQEQPLGDSIDPYRARNSASNRCPYCGSALVLRTAKRGERAGKQFYGCSAYPQCHYILNI